MFDFESEESERLKSKLEELLAICTCHDDNLSLRCNN